MFEELVRILLRGLITLVLVFLTFGIPVGAIAFLIWLAVIGGSLGKVIAASLAVLVVSFILGLGEEY